MAEIKESITIKLDSLDLEFLMKFEKTLQAFIKLVEVIVEKEADIPTFTASNDKFWEDMIKKEAEASDT
jgi:hypothetical protein